MASKEKIIKNKVGLLKLAEELVTVSQASRIISYSRNSFYWFGELYSEQGETGLCEISYQGPNPKNQVAPKVEEVVTQFVIDNLAYRQKRVSNELKKRGIFLGLGVCAQCGTKL